MKSITLILTAASALFLSSCACTKGGSCCSSCSSCSSGDATMACCKDAAAKGMKCEKCAMKPAATKKTM